MSEVTTMDSSLISANVKIILRLFNINMDSLRSSISDLNNQLIDDHHQLEKKDEKGTSFDDSLIQIESAEDGKTTTAENTEPISRMDHDGLVDTETNEKKFDFEQVVELCCIEIISLHLRGNVASRNSKYSRPNHVTAEEDTASSSDGANPSKLSKNSPRKEGKSLVEKMATSDVGMLLCYWFLDSIERVFEFERSFPKVRLQVIFSRLLKEKEQDFNLLCFS